MYPVLFRIGGFDVTSFGVLVAICALVGLTWRDGGWPAAMIGDLERGFIIAPVSERFAGSFTSQADTFDAIGRDPEALKATISKTPPTLDASSQTAQKAQNGPGADSSPRKTPPTGARITVMSLAGAPLSLIPMCP